MSLLTVNGFRALHAKVTFPVSGAWRILTDLDTPTMPPGPLAIVGPGIALTGATLSGRIGAFRGRISLRGIGGAGKLGTALVAKTYTNATVKLILGDILREAGGEVLSSTADAGMLATQFPFYARASGPAGQALAMLLDALPSSTWRVLDDGTIWIGKETWPASGMIEQVLDSQEASARAVLTGESPTLRPGQTIEGRKVTRVSYVFEPGGVRTEVGYGS